MSHRITVFLFLCIVCLGINSCANHEKTIVELDLKREISEFRDSIFFHPIRGALFQEDKIILPGVDKVLVLDQDLELQFMISNYGKGPKEFQEVLSSAYYNGQFYLFDNSSRTIKIYNREGEYVDYIKPNGSMLPLFIQRFNIANENLILAGKDSLLLYNVFSHKSKAIKPVSQGSLTSVFHLGSNDLMLVSHTAPTIEIWNLNSDKSQIYDYSETELIKKTIANIDKGGGGTFMLVSDAYHWGNRLFLLLATLDENVFASNMIVIFNLDSREIESTMYKLPDKAYISICVLSDSELLVSSYDNGSLQIFDY